MKYFIHITIIPEEGISSGFILQKMFRDLHIGLVETEKKLNRQPIGISFPKYDEKGPFLGDCLRLHAEEESVLESFNAAERFSILSDYLHLSRIREIPSDVDYALFKRFQPKDNPIKLARRNLRRLEKWEKEGDREKIDRFQQNKKKILEKEEEHPRTIPKLPYIIMKSGSTGKSFSLFINKIKISKPESQKSNFTCYGLSNTTPVPVFRK